MARINRARSQPPVAAMRFAVKRLEVTRDRLNPTLRSERTVAANLLELQEWTARQLARRVATSK